MKRIVCTGRIGKAAIVAHTWALSMALIYNDKRWHPHLPGEIASLSQWPGQKQRWHVCLHGVEVDQKPVGRGLLKWQIARFLAAQNTVHVTSGLAKHFQY